MIIYISEVKEGLDIELKVSTLRSHRVFLRSHLYHFTRPPRLLLVRQLWFPVKPVTGGRRETEVVAMKLAFIKKSRCVYCSVSDGFE